MPLNNFGRGLTMCNLGDLLCDRVVKRSFQLQVTSHTESLASCASLTMKDYPSYQYWGARSKQSQLGYFRQLLNIMTMIMRMMRTTWIVRMWAQNHAWWTNSLTLSCM